MDQERRQTQMRGERFGEDREQVEKQWWTQQGKEAIMEVTPESVIKDEVQAQWIVDKVQNISDVCNIIHGSPPTPFP